MFGGVREKEMGYFIIEINLDFSPVDLGKTGVFIFPSREFFTHMETSPLLAKGCKV